MRRILLLILSALLLTILCGCSGSDAGQREPRLPEEPYCLLTREELRSLPAAEHACHVYSHQGTGLEEWPETFAAYDLVYACGSRYLEQDVVVSADGVLYCCHDLTPAALTGETRPFSELTAAQIDELRTTDGRQRLLRLSDVFDRYGTLVTYLVELKQWQLSCEPFLALLEEYPLLRDRIILQSSELDCLRRFETEYPEMRKLFLVFEKEKFDKALAEPCVDIVSVDNTYFDRESCDRVHAAGKEFNVAVVNPAWMIRKAIELGADSYFTDYTAKALALENNFRK